MRGAFLDVPSFGHTYQNPNLTTTGMLFISGEELYLDRLSLAQLTQLFLTSVLECPFYKVRARAGLPYFSVGAAFFCLPSPNLLSFSSFDLSQ